MCVHTWALHALTHGCTSSALAESHWLRDVFRFEQNFSPGRQAGGCHYPTSLIREPGLHWGLLAAPGLQGKWTSGPVEPSPANPRAGVRVKLAVGPSRDLSIENNKEAPLLNFFLFFSEIQ